MKYIIKVYSRKLQDYVLEISSNDLEKHLEFYKSIIEEFSDSLYEFNIITKVEEK